MEDMLWPVGTIINTIMTQTFLFTNWCTRELL